MTSTSGTAREAGKATRWAAPPVTRRYAGTAYHALAGAAGSPAGMALGGRTTPPYAGAP